MIYTREQAIEMGALSESGTVLAKWVSALPMEDMIENIRRVWLSNPSRDGLDWYLQANREAKAVSRETGIALDTVCRVIAVVSPNMEWESNLRTAKEMIWAHVAGIDIRTIPGWMPYPVNVDKAQRILEGDDSALRGPKVEAFYSNLLNPVASPVVTVDRHAIAIACGLQFAGEFKVSLKALQKIASAYEILADELEISPLSLQAATWVERRYRLAA